MIKDACDADESAMAKPSIAAFGGYLLFLSKSSLSVILVVDQEGVGDVLNANFLEIYIDYII